MEGGFDMNKQITSIYDSLQEITWNFGAHGINGECCDDLSAVEFMALKKAHQINECSVQELGNALNFTKSGATRIVNRLEEKGYVLRKNSPIDGRVCCVTITDKGEDILSRIMKKYILYLENLLKEFEPEKIKHINDALEILVNVVQQNDPINTNSK